MSQLNLRRRSAWGQNASQIWPDLVIIVILALLPTLFFWRLVAPNPVDRMNIPSGDFTEQYYPLRAYVTRELAAGRLPLWNPSPYGGQPALADIQSGALYPPQIIEAIVLNWLGLDFPVWALELQAIMHFAWAAIGAYLLGRRLAQRASATPRYARFTGIIVSLVFTYSGYLTGFPVQQLTILEVSAWAPWVLLGMEVLATRDGKRVTGRWVFAGTVLGLSLLPGHPQTSLYVTYIAIAFYLFRTASYPLAARRWLTTAGFLLVTLVLAFSLAAAQLLPTLEFITHSPRADMSYQALSFGLPLHELVSLVYPGYFGGSPEYVGILPMILIGLALTLSRAGRQRGDVVFWTVAGLLAMLLAFGGNTFLYPIFYLLAPGFDAVRHQERVFLVYALSAAVLSGYGALALATPLGRVQRIKLRHFERRLRVIFGATLALTALFFFGWVGSEHPDLFGGVLRHHVLGLILLAGSLILLSLRSARALRRPWGMTLVASWIAFNLFSVNWQFNLEQPQATGPFAPTPLTEFLSAQTWGSSPWQPGQKEPVRIASAGLLPGGPGAGSVYGLNDITGNTPLNLASVEAFNQGVPEWRRWQLLNVHYILSDRDLSGPGLTQVFPPDEPEAGENEVRIYAMGDPFPHAWVVHAVEIIADEKAALARISADEFDLRQVAVVSEPAAISLPGDEKGSTARITGLVPGEVTVDVDAGADGLLVLSEIHYPGWRASVDGKPARLIRADGVLRGVPVPQGRHTVRVWYAPTSVRLGLIFSALALVVIGGTGVQYLVSTRRTPVREQQSG